MIRRLTIASLLATVLLAVCGPAQALAAGPAWRFATLSNSTVAPGSTLTYHLELANVGDAPTNGDPITLIAELPPGLIGVSADTASFDGVGGFSCPAVSGKSTIECTGTPIVTPIFGNQVMTVTVAVDPGAAGVLTTVFDLSGGGAAVPVRAIRTLTVTAAEPAFAIEAFDTGVWRDGTAYTLAGGHPKSQSTSFEVTAATDPSPVVGDAYPLEDVRDVVASLPAGLYGDPALLPRCTQAELANGEFQPRPLCPPGSQLGIAAVLHPEGIITPVAIYNMAPPPSAPARFAFNVNGSIVVLDAHPRTSSDYGLDIVVSGVPQGLAILGNTVDIWGVPSDQTHDSARACSGENTPYNGGQTCPATGLPIASFLRNPTSCAAPGDVTNTIAIDTWQHPGDFASRSVLSHEAPGYPLSPEPSLFPAGYSGPEEWGDPVGVEGCDEVPFEPTLDASLTTDRADSPTGLSVDIGLPSDCWDAKATVVEAEESICQSDLREAKVTLPQGLSLNPAAAGGRASCTPDQIGLSTPVGTALAHFDEAPASCPEAAKIGTVELETPLLSLRDNGGKPIVDSEGKPALDPLEGSVYLAQQSQNPFGSLLGIYLVAEGNGVRVKQAGEISLSASGQVTTTFEEAPQTPVSGIHVELFGGSGAALRTPAACGTYSADATLTPWSGNGAVQRSSSFQITQGCGGGFDPKLSAGTQNPLAGGFSPFGLRLTREDGSQELGGLSLTLPPGLIGAPKGIPYCPESLLAAFPTPTVIGSGTGEIAAPRCPAASRVGTVTVGAGSGPNPFYTTTGKAYLAGPYKGAPLSLAVVAPAVAGPFDLGTVLVRNALRVDPETTQITAVSDPLPTIVHGIPLDLRDVRVDLDRPDFTLNPTSCEPMSIASTITSIQGATANPSSHFQAAGCDRLKFKPKLSLRLKGGTRRSKHPALTAILTPRKGDANIGRVQVALPRAEFLAQSHIKTICTRVQFAAGGGGGAECPKGSIYGKVSATSPLVDYPLAGNVYLRSSNNPLPDMVLALNGPPSQPLQVAAVGRIDSSESGGIRTTFAAVPDAPLTKVVLRLPGGKKSLLENSRNLCRRPVRATVQIDAHNGRLADSTPKLRVDCGSKGGKAKGHRG